MRQKVFQDAEFIFCFLDEYFKEFGEYQIGFLLSYTNNFDFRAAP